MLIGGAWEKGECHVSFPTAEGSALRNLTETNSNAELLDSDNNYKTRSLVLILVKESKAREKFTIVFHQVLNISIVNFVTDGRYIFIDQPRPASFRRGRGLSVGGEFCSTHHSGLTCSSCMPA